MDSATILFVLLALAAGAAAGWVLGTAIRSAVGPLSIIGDAVSAAVLGAVTG